MRVAGEDKSWVRDTLDEIERLQIAKCEELASAPPAPVQRDSFKAWGELWLSRKAGTPGHLAYEDRWLLHLATAPFANVDVRDITRAEVHEFLDRVQKKQIVRHGKKKV